MFNLTTQSKLYLCETIKFKNLYWLLWNRFWGRFYWIKINSFSAHISMPKLLHWGFCLYFSVLRSTSVRSSVGFKISARVRQSSMTTHCGQAWISLGKSLYKDILFLCPQWSSGPYIPRNFLIWTHFVNTSGKNRTYARTFPVQRKEINAVVKVRFTMV